MRHVNLDAATIDWLTQHPSEARLDIACTLLSGLWKHDVEGVIVGAQAVDRLVFSHEQIGPGEAVEYGYRLALTEAGILLCLPADGARNSLKRALQQHLSNAVCSTASCKMPCGVPAQPVARR